MGHGPKPQNPTPQSPIPNPQSPCFSNKIIFLGFKININLIIIIFIPIKE
jgi:hypothetical protein